MENIKGIEFKSRSEMNLTEGNLFFKMIKLALPLMMTSVFQLLYTTVDLWTVSEFGGGSLSMSAIGSQTAMISLIITMLVSLSVGSNVCMSVAKGANNRQKAERILHTAFLIAFVGGFIFSILGFILSPQILKLMDTPASIFEKAKTYLRIYFIGLPLLMIYNFGSQMLRALGDSKRPMYFLFISGFINVLFDILFVIVFGLDVAGVAIATIISQFISALLTILWFKKSPTVYVNLDFKKLKFYKEELKDILKVGIPAGLQGLCFSIPNVIIQSSLYTITNYEVGGILISQEEIISGASASAQIEGYVFVLLDAIGISLTSFTGQNMGALKKKNMIRCYGYAFIWVTSISLFVIGIVKLFPTVFLNIFINDGENVNTANAILAGKERMKIMVSFYFVNGWMNISAGYLKGMKKSLYPFLITLIGCSIFRVVFLLTVFRTEYFHTIFWLYATMPISWALCVCAYIPTILTIQKKVFKEMDKKLLLTSIS